MLRCALCPWVGPPARDTAHAQDLLVSHHNDAHGRPPGGHWPVYGYDNSAAHAEAARRYAALFTKPDMTVHNRRPVPLILDPVEHDYVYLGAARLELWTRLRDWWTRRRTPAPQTPLRQFTQCRLIGCPGHPEPRLLKPAPDPTPGNTFGRRKGTW